MKKLVSMILAGIVPLSAVPMAAAAPAPFIPDVPVILAISARNPSGRVERQKQRERNSQNALIHRILQSHIRLINTERNRARSRTRYDAVIRLKTRLNADLRLIAAKQAQERRILLNRAARIPKRSRRFLRQEVKLRREIERCRASAKDPCQCPCMPGHVRQDVNRPQSSQVFKRKEQRLKRIKARVEQKNKRGSRRHKALFPRSPRHTWKRAEQQEKIHERAIERMKNRYNN